MASDQDFESEIDEGQEMTFLEHLEELRWHIIRAVGSIVIFAILAWVYREWIYGVVILGPSKPEFWTYQMMCKVGHMMGTDGLCVESINFKLQNIEVGGQFKMALTTAGIVGLLFAFPYAFWEIWRFIKPGLKISEKKAARGAVFFVTLLFFSGVLFGYYVVTPLVINFLANFTLDESIVNEFNIKSYISTIATLTLACGVAFQLPIVIFVLSKAGIVTPAFMREYRKHSVVVILIVAAIITPSPDIFSQVIVALPLFLLYEVGIFVSARVERQRRTDDLALQKRLEEGD
ncbi:twin-arginine translocase subunit TatC [Ravibacter arvi]|uniref:Sec-independent protein translocase protein TatC n=1 Tax=Ravibacter arvi TaxID=2051041 RepID=A0ABP8MBW2_9BACT